MAPYDVHPYGSRSELEALIRDARDLMRVSDDLRAKVLKGAKLQEQDHSEDQRLIKGAIIIFAFMICIFSIFLAIQIAHFSKRLTHSPVTDQAYTNSSGVGNAGDRVKAIEKSRRRLAEKFGLLPGRNE